MREHLLLVERLIIEQRLLEDRVSYLRQNYLKRLETSGIAERLPANVRAQVEAVDSSSIDTPLPEKLFLYILAFDPDPTKRHAQWLLNMLLKNNMQVEDLPEARDLLSKFISAKGALPPDQKDINRYRSLGALAAVVDSGTEYLSNREIDRRLERAMLAQADVLLDTSEYRIVVPKTEEASCFFGVNTRWCTAARSSVNYFNHYNRQGPLYIVLHKPTNRRWQFHFPSKQFMDETDTQINLEAFKAEHPKIARFFEELDEKAGEFLGNVGNARAVREGDAIVLKKGFGLSRKQDIARFSVSNGVIDHVSDGFVYNDGYFENRELIDVLNKANVAPAPRVVTRFAEKGIFYDPKKKWGTITIFPKSPSTSVPGVFWYRYKIPNADVHYAAAVDRSGKRLLFAALHTPSVQITTPDGVNTDETVLTLFVEYLSFTKKAKEFRPDSLNPSILSAELAEQLLKNRPDLGDAALKLKVYGPDDRRVHHSIRKHFQDNGIDIDGRIIENNKIILNVYDSPEELGEAAPGDQFEYFRDIVNGDEFIDVDVGDPSFWAKNFLSELKTIDPALLEKLGRHLKETQSEWIEDKQTYDPDYEFDPTSADDIFELYSATEDYDLSSAISAAVSTGYEAGYQSEAAEIYKSAFEKVPYVYFLKNGKWVREFVWDGKCAVIVPVEEVVNAIQEEATFELDNWLAFTGETIDPQVPYYGFSDFDTGAAVERFLEEVREIVE
mgnify:FL=1